MTEAIPTLNVELLTTLVKWAGQDEADLTDYFTKMGFPKWNQEVWAEEVRNGVCQTACCIAGNAVIQAGYALDYESKPLLLADVSLAKFGYDTKTAQQNVTYYGANYCGPKIKVGETDEGKPIYGPDPNKIDYVPTVAQEVLGLTYGERSSLFDGSNNLEDVVFFAMLIAKRRGLALDLPEALANLGKEPSERLKAYNYWADAEAAERDVYTRWAQYDSEV